MTGRTYGTTNEEHQRRRAELKAKQKAVAEKRNAPVEALLKELEGRPGFEPRTENRADGTMFKLILGGSGFHLYVHGYAEKWQVGFMFGFKDKLSGRITSEQLVAAIRSKFA